MSKDKFIDALKSKNSCDKKTIHAMGKIERQERLSSAEFLKVYQALRKEGPSIKYQNPDLWYQGGRSADYV